MDEMIKEFKAEYKKKGPDNLQSQAKYLAQLAELYHQKGKDNSDDWVSLLKAHTLYNSVAARDTENERKWSEKVFNVQKSYWGDTVSLTYEQQREITHTIKQALTKVRQTTKCNLNHVKQNYINFNCEFDKIVSQENQELYKQFTEKMERVSLRCTEDMIRVFNLIISKSVEIVGEPPCGLCVAAMGSLARGEATPFSDLEFMFLIETKSEQTTKYFERLAIIIYLQISNLQETNMRYMAIAELADWFEDLSTNGLKIDGLQPWAGNIPTGNGSSTQQNHLICTVAELATKYKSIYDNPHPVESLRGDMTAMLSCTVSLYQYGDIDLHSEFRSAIREIKPNQERAMASERMLEEDRKKFSFYFTNIAEKLNLKKEIYRYISILILDLKIIHCIEAKPFKVVTCLLKQGIVSRPKAHHLTFTYCCALYIRLSAYLDHSSQNENISTLKPNEDFTGNRDVWYIDRSLVLHMLVHLALLKMDHEVMTKDVISFAMATYSFNCDDFQKCYQILKKITPGIVDDIDIALLKAECTCSLNKFDEAEEILLWLANSGALSGPCRTENLNVVYSNLVSLYLQTDRLDKSHIYSLKLKGLRNQSHSAFDPVNMKTPYSLDSILLTLFNEQLPSNASSGKRKQLQELILEGSTYVCQGMPTEAQKIGVEALQLAFDVYGRSTRNVPIVHAYCILFHAFRLQRKWKQAAENMTIAAQMYKQIVSGNETPMLYDMYFLLGNAQFNMEDFKSAAVSFTAALDSNRRHDPTLIDSRSLLYQRLVWAYHCQGEYEKANACQREYSELKEKQHCYSKYLDEADNHLSEGLLCENQKLYKMAEENYTRSLETYQKLLDDSGHLKLAECYQALMRVTVSLKDNGKALKYYYKYISEHFKLLRQQLISQQIM